jgi:hypothetical protein
MFWFVGSDWIQHHLHEREETLAHVVGQLYLQHYL